MKKLLSWTAFLSVFVISLPVSASVFLHGTGPNANPPTLYLDHLNPTNTTTKYKDSVGVKFAGGNQWKEVGTWRVSPSEILAELLNDLHVWLGLKNSDDIGTNFDLRAEIYKNDTILITFGEVYCINGITRNPDLAKEVVVSFGSLPPVDFYGTDMLFLKILTRIGTNGTGAFCGGHNNAVGLRLYFDAASRPSRFDAVSRENSPPVANAGENQHVRVDDLVTLDGRESHDPDSDLITYRWKITIAPSESDAELDNPSSVMPSFVPHKPGDYIIALTVNDGQLDSNPNSVSVIAAQPNVAPTAIAGPDQSVAPESQVFLDGRRSFDPDGDPLTYRWQIVSLPAGSTALLDNPTSSKPSFWADRNGQYVILLIVNDGRLDSFPDDVSVISSAPNAPPIAYAGDDQIVFRNTLIRLDASGCYDPDNDLLNYNWSIVSSPAGSECQFGDPTSPTQEILADKEGEYVFRLVVSDGQLYSNPHTVVVKSVNNPPIVHPGGPYTGVMGISVLFNGSGSSDSDGDPMTFSWNFGDGSTGSGVNPAHTYLSAGTYTVTLRVEDGRGGSGSSQTTAQVNNPAPFLSSINPSSITTGNPDFTLTLNGDNFLTTSIVSFNNNQYSMRYVNKTQIEATIPASAITTTGNYPVKVTNPTPGGGETSVLSFAVKPRLEIAITSPSDGEAINKAKVMVRGTVRSDTKDLGITVNGILAETTGNDWIVNNVPLATGSNIITAVATDYNGNRVSKVITVNANSISQFVELSANITSGIPPLQTYFSVSTSNITPASYQMDFDGDGVIDYNGINFDTLSYAYPSQGVFYPKVTISDDQGNVYSDTIAITVLSKTELDALLRSKWEGIREKLLSGDIETALSFFDETSKQDYRDLFNVLSSVLPTIVQEMADIQFIEYVGNTAIYDIQTTRNGTEYSFQLLFVKDNNGTWRINSF